MGFQTMNKKGSLPDLMYIVAFLFVFAITTIVMVSFYNSYTAEVNENEAFNNTWTQDFQEQSDSTFLTFDYIFIFILFGLLMLTIVAGLRIKTNPVFFFLSLFLLIVTIIVGVVLSNVYGEMTDATAFSATSSNYVIMEFFFNHLPMFVVFIGLSIMLLFYAKDRIMD